MTQLICGKKLALNDCLQVMMPTFACGKNGQKQAPSLIFIDIHVIIILWGKLLQSLIIWSVSVFLEHLRGKYSALSSCKQQNNQYDTMTVCQHNANTNEAVSKEISNGKQSCDSHKCPGVIVNLHTAAKHLNTHVKLFWQHTIHRVNFLLITL